MTNGKKGDVRAVGYLRVSSKSQVENGFGLPAQRRAVKDFAKERGWRLVALIEDGGESGANLDRPGLGEVDALVRSGAANTVLVARLDRLSRSVLHQETLLADWTRRGARLVSCAEPDLDETDPERKFVRQVLAAVAELDRARLKARLKGGAVAKVRAGGYAGGRVALGYSVKDGRLVVNPEEAGAVKRAVALRRKGLGYHSVALHLAEEGFPTKRGGTWHASTVRRLLTSAQVRGRVTFAGQGAKGEHKALVRGAK